MASQQLPPRALLRTEAVTDSVQEIFDEDLVLAPELPTFETESNQITYWLQQNAQSEGQMPGPWDLGQDDFPEITTTEPQRESVSLEGLAAKMRFDAPRLEWGTDRLQIVDDVNVLFRKFAEKFEELAAEEHTNNWETANGSDFDSDLTYGTGGYATDGGHVVFQPDAGEEWNNGGDFVDQLQDFLNVFMHQGRKNDDAGDVRIRENDLIAYADSDTINQIHKQLRVSGKSPGADEVPREITIPDVYSLTVRKANFAIPTDGRMIVKSQRENPVVGYYHNYQRLNDVGFNNISREDHPFPMQVKDEDESNGGATMYAASGSVMVNRKPKYTAFLDGLLS